MVDDRYGNQDCRTYIDMRELIAQPDIDAVMIATGDNNQSLISVLAARAGKDIYCEKPLSVTIAESRAVADTVRRHARIFQCGTQRRNVGNFVFVRELARSGALGNIHTVYAEKAWPDSKLQYKVLPEQPTPPYEEMAWDLWLGGAAWRPYNDQYPTGFWRSHGDFSGGSITEWGSLWICASGFWARTIPLRHLRSINPLGDVEAVYAMVPNSSSRPGSASVPVPSASKAMKAGPRPATTTSSKPIQPPSPRAVISPAATRRTITCANSSTALNRGSSPGPPLKPPTVPSPPATAPTSPYASAGPSAGTP